MTFDPLPTGSTIGIIGGGQLGRMLAIAAARLGYRCHIYSPEEQSCAAEVAAHHFRGRYNDLQNLRLFAGDCDVVTYEFENIQVGPLHALAEDAPIRPHPRCVELAQDRVAEKEFVKRHGGKTATFRPCDSAQAVHGAAIDVGLPGILKTRHMGYDGKGQVRVITEEGAHKAWEAIGEKPAIYEEYIDFDNEFSIIAVRGADGTVRFWDAPENRHVNGILAESKVPSGNIVPDQRQAATVLSRAIMEALDYVGVLTVEFFTALDGPVFNEMAPRVHNSGHWTIEGSETSQFENHIRAICGLPLGETDLTAKRVEMTNLIGDGIYDWGDWLDVPRAHIHVYNKGEIRAGRKMGHVTQLY